MSRTAPIQGGKTSVEVTWLSDDVRVRRSDEDPDALLDALGKVKHLMALRRLTS